MEKGSSLHAGCFFDVKKGLGGQNEANIYRKNYRFLWQTDFVLKYFSESNLFGSNLKAQKTKRTIFT